MSNRTTKIRRTFNNTIGAGFRSIFQPNSSYFILEHQLGSTSMSAGYSRKFIVDYIELGRAKSCDFRFGESDSTVSRIHAAIFKDNGRYSLEHRSSTNSTLVNGKIISDRWFLSNGDVIQLSHQGPKINFILPVNNTVGTIGLTKRLSMFAYQSLRPMKRALILGSILIIALIVSGNYYIFSRIKDGENIFVQHKSAMLATIDSLNNENLERQDSIKNLLNDQKEEMNISLRNIRSPEDKKSIFKSLENSFEKDIYFMVIDDIKVKMPDGEYIHFDDLGGTATAFLNDEGHMITARHCVEPWLYKNSLLRDSQMLYLNLLASNGGKIECVYKFYSPGLEKTFYIEYNKFKINRNNDKTYYWNSDDGESLKYIIQDDLCNDIAFAKVDHKGSIKTDPEYSQLLQLGDAIYSVGYPQSIGAGRQPIYSSNTISYKGLFKECILITDINIDFGSSGGPLFAKKGNSFVVVGVVSGGIGDRVGRITPISALNL